MIAALYVEAGGCYFGWPDIDAWDVSRDARLYAGPHPVVAHPPCQRWGRMATGGPSAPGRYLVGDPTGDGRYPIRIGITEDHPITGSSHWCGEFHQSPESLIVKQST